MATSTEERIMILVYVFIDPSEIDKFLEAFYEVVEKCKKEPECERFEVFKVPTEEGEFRWVETWKGSRDWFLNVQMNKPYYEPYTAVTQPMWLKPRIIEFIEHIPNFSPYIQSV